METASDRDDLAYDRTHLATERTYAAWLRTGLSVAAGGIAIARLVPAPSRGSLLSLLLGACFVLLGIAIMSYGAWQFALTTRRLCSERARPLPTTPRNAYALTGSSPSCSSPCCSSSGATRDASGSISPDCDAAPLLTYSRISTPGHAFSPRLRARAHRALRLSPH